MKKGMRFWSLCLAVLMLFMITPVMASERNAEEAPVDFVILLDCSTSLRYNDPDNLCLEACKNFVDKLPTENARVAVVAFGYLGGEVYTYTEKFEAKLRDDSDRIHMIVPLDDLSSSDQKEAYKDVVEKTVLDNITNMDTATPLGHAMACGADILTQANTPAGKGCIILVSDGVLAPKTIFEDPRLLNLAKSAVREQEWPTYCIELNYNNVDTAVIEEAQRVLDDICQDQKVGRIRCRTPKDVHMAFQEIFQDFFELEKVPPVEVKLPGEYEFDVPELTSEATVDVFGSTVEKVELYHEDSDTPIKITKSTETENLRAVVEEGSYYSVKMFCPEEGHWKVQIHGDANATVLVSNSSLQEMEIEMVTNPSPDAGVLNRDDILSVDAYFKYHEFEAHNNDFYEKNDASLLVTTADKTVKEYTMDATKDGYHFDLDIQKYEIPSGSFTVQVSVKHNMFRNGQKISNKEAFSIENEEMSLTGAGPDSIHGYVNGDMDQIDLSKIFLNPDRDQITYELVCASDRTVNFEYAIDADYMNVKSGLRPGEYAMEIRAKDKEMAEPLVYPMTFVVENRPAQAGSLEKLKLWSDKSIFQKEKNNTASYTLSEYFTDPDQLPLTYSASASADGVVQTTVTGDVLKIDSAENGKVLLTVTANDGYEDTSIEFEVSVVSGKGVYWATHWILWAIGAGIVLLILFIIIFLLKNKRVKGKWQFTFEQHGMQYQIDAPINLRTHTSVGRKKKFKFVALMSDLFGFISDSQWNEAISNLAANASVKDIEFVGVIFGKGCVIRKIPKSSNLVITLNGAPVNKKVTVRHGNVRFNITDDSGSTLSVTMETV